MVLAAFEIDDSWIGSDGLIDDPRRHRPQANHSLVLIGCDQVSETLRFTHSSGPEWGDGGFGSLPYRYWSDRLLEAWIPDNREAAVVEAPAASDFVVIKRDAKDPWGHAIHLIEVEDPIRDEMMGWTIMRQSSTGLEMDEFFVRPNFRRLGHGRRLVRAVAKIRADLGVPLIAWVPHADASPTKAQDAIFRKLRLERRTTTERWAASCAIERKP